MKSNSRKLEKENLLMEERLLHLKQRLKGEQVARRYEQMFSIIPCRPEVELRERSESDRLN